MSEFVDFPTKVTAAMAMQALHDTIGQNREYQYNPNNERSGLCFYVEYEQPDTFTNPTAPSCGVGRASYKLGLPLDTLAIADAGEFCSPSSWYRHLNMSAAAGFLFEAVQDVQDTYNKTWGQAMDKADTIYKLLQTKLKGRIDDADLAEIQSVVYLDDPLN